MAAGGVVAVALTKVAEGFLEAAGKKIFDLLYNAIFGSRDKVDLNEFSRLFSDTLEIFANDLKLHVDHAFALERRKRAELHLKNLTSLMRLYSASNETSSDLLDDCVVAGNEAVTALEEVGHLAAVQYVSAVTLLIAVYEERMVAISSEQRSSITNVIVPVGVETYREMRHKIENEVTQRARITTQPIWNIPGNGEISGVRIRVVVDDHVIEESFFRGETDYFADPNYESLQVLLTEQRSRLTKELDISMKGPDSLVKSWQEKYS